MESIQVIRLLDLLEVNSISNAAGVHPRSIVVQGSDFRSVEQVLINGMVSPEFVVYSTTRLVAEVPETISDSIITDVAVLSNTITLTDRSLVEFTLGTRPKKATGTLRLMQVFLRQLLRTPGSNLFHPRSGGGMLRRVGGNISNTAAADIAVAVSTTKNYIVGAQSGERRIPPAERLLSAEIGGVTVDPSNTSIYVTIVLTSHSGKRGAATLTA